MLQNSFFRSIVRMVMEKANDATRAEFLYAYAHTYLKEEIVGEQLVRDLDPFRRFLEIAAQMNGKIINYSKIANDVNVSDKTVKTYFSILEDTLIGFFLEAKHDSVRKQLGEKPKFYLFDCGVVRALANQLEIPLNPGTLAFGNAFEHFIINECVRTASYLRRNYKFSYMRTRNDVEIDLIIERPGAKTLYIEIKSTDQIQANMLTSFKAITKDIGDGEALCFSNDPYTKQFDHVLATHWREGLAAIFK